ncbi:MAG TPA: nucleotide exchange factor GrpE [Gemmatimonadaceae bacterium]|nr:nucleotide exchange factor GrpE [Gemmatimonadaceae bacterium]
MTERPDSSSDDAATFDGAEIPHGTDEQSDATATAGDERAALERDLAEQRDKYLRLAAEYDNFRKRAMRERSEAGQRGQAELVKQLVDALDDLARFAHVDPSTVDAATVVQGAEMVEKKLLKALAAAGLTIINPQDEPFDPALHEAVSTEPALSREDDHMVSRVYQSGYQFGTQLLRPARVVVKQWNG